jgi:hypothetical protein
MLTLDCSLLERVGLFSFQPQSSSGNDFCQRSLSSRFLFALMRVSFFKNVITDNILSRALSVSLPLSSCRRRSRFCSGRSHHSSLFWETVSSSFRIHTIQCSFSLPQQTGIRSFTKRTYSMENLSKKTMYPLLRNFTHQKRSNQSKKS